MYDLTYCSLAKPTITAEEISAILHSAKKHNKENKITGCLFYYNHEFLQVLEGEKGIVKAVYAKISKDPRHTNVRILAEGDKEQRTFDSWTMAFKELNAEEIRNMNDATFENNFLTFSELVSKPTRTIRSFWEKAQHIIMKNEGPQ
jgi:hypothetical protein